MKCIDGFLGFAGYSFFLFLSSFLRMFFWSRFVVFRGRINGSFTYKQRINEFFLVDLINGLILHVFSLDL